VTKEGNGGESIRRIEREGGEKAGLLPMRGGFFLRELSLERGVNKSKRAHLAEKEDSDWYKHLIGGGRPHLKKNTEIEDKI